MSARKLTAPIPAIAVQRPEAAAALGLSVDSFMRHVASEVRCVRRGSLRLYPVSELQRWAEENAHRLLEGET